MSSYTWSRFREKVAPLNPWDELEDRLSPVDRPHRFTFASVVELPFGQGRKFGTDWGPVVDGFLGGWQFAAKYEWQTGQPLTWTNNTYYDPGCGDPSSLTSSWGDAPGRAALRRRRSDLRHELLLHVERSTVQERGGHGPHEHGA